MTVRSGRRSFLGVLLISGFGWGQARRSPEPNLTWEYRRWKTGSGGWIASRRDGQPFEWASMPGYRQPDICCEIGSQNKETFLKAVHKYRTLFSPWKNVS